MVGFNDSVNIKNYLTIEQGCKGWDNGFTLEIDEREELETH
jgi:hypothetical protein